MNKYKLALVNDGTLEYGRIGSPDQIAIIAKSIIGNEAQEVLGMFALDVKNNVLGYFEISRGAVDSCQVPIYEIVKRMVMLNAKQVVLIHNHPSGDTSPSVADLDATNNVIRAMEILECRLLDHIIVSDSSYTSIREVKPNIFK